MDSRLRGNDKEAGMTKKLKRGKIWIDKEAGMTKNRE
jgi:hypothetical protein